MAENKKQKKEPKVEWTVVYGKSQKPDEQPKIESCTPDQFRRFHKIRNMTLKDLKEGRD